MKILTTNFAKLNQIWCRGQMLLAFSGLLFGMMLGGYQSAQATHMAGTDVTYEHISGNTYRFTQVIYRDCAGVGLPASRTLTVSPTNNGSIISLTRTRVEDITPLCPGQQSRCATAAGAYGIEAHTYVGNFNLAALPPGQVYTITTTLIARNNAITTISAPGSQYLLTNTTLNPSMFNTSPTFGNPPSAFLCVGQPAIISPNAFDADGDALVYELTPCLTANGNSVTYNPGLSFLDPLPTTSGLSLNPGTGNLTFTPSAVSVSVICVKVTEFRNGVAIGTVVRDIQVRTLNCNNTPPVVSPIASVVVLPGQTYCVNVTATDANNDNITMTATSGIIPPATFVINSSSPGSTSGTFCFTPTVADEGNTYTVTINAVDDACPTPSSGATTFNITVPIQCRANTTVTGTNATCAGASDGSASGMMTGGTPPFSYSWTGPNGFSSFSQNITNLAPGQYCLLIVDGNSCTDDACVTISGSSSPVGGSATVVGANCGQANGSVTLAGSGGTAPYTYTFNGSASNGTITGLSQGTYTYTVTDAIGCDFTGTATVTQAADVTAPVISCPANITVNNDAGVCGANVTFAATATDDCGVPTVTQTAGGASGSLFAVGSSSVTFTATDGSGNASSCSFSVTVNDNENPVISCPANMTMNTNPGVCGAVVNYSASATDNCSATASVSPSSGSFFQVGTTTVSATATDPAGNSAACSFTVTVEDNEAPVIDCNVAGGIILGPRHQSLANDVTLPTDPGVCGAYLEYDNEASDNCSFTVAQTAGLPTASTFPVGSTTNTFVVTDASGNTATCTFNVIVEDLENPVATCPANITVSNDPGVCGANVAYSANATDNCSATVAVSPASGSFFQVGTATVTATATDPSGNTSTCSFDVTVNDTEAPVIDCNTGGGIILGQSFANDVTLPTDAGICGAYYEYQNDASDNCAFTVAQTAGLPTASTFPVGTTTNTYVVTDASGNTATCSFNVIVEDLENPVISCPANITVDTDAGVCGASVPFSVTATDNCSATVSTSVASGSLFATGTTTVSGTATDPSGNTAACSFTVTVNDNEAPVITCPSNIAVNNDAGVCGADVNYTVNATDNCSATVVVNPVSGSQFAIGTTTVNATATDPSGNTATCAFTVTVTDNEAPNAVCNNLTVQLDANGQGSVTAAMVDGGSTDNCAVASVSIDNGSFGCSNTGANTVTLTVVDVNGNNSTCTSTVTVEDNIAPSITCPADLNLECLSELQPANIAEVTSSDNCSAVVAHVGDSNNGGSGCAGDARIITRTYSATDPSGNSTTCSQTITIESTPVVAHTSGNTYVFPQVQDSSCATISVVGSGGCAPYTYAWDNGSSASSQSVCPTVTTVYTVTVTDSEGCSGVDSVQVCAIDLTCTDRTNNGQNGSGQSGNGVNQNGNAMLHIAICHVPPGNANNAMTKCLPVPAALMHVSQGHGGDYLGACGSIASRNCDFGAANKSAQPQAAEVVAPLNVSMEAFPNPFSNATTVRVSLDQDADMDIVIFDLTGKVVANLYHGAATANIAVDVEFNANNLSAGTYVARMITSTGVMKTIRLNLTK